MSASSLRLLEVCIIYSHIACEFIYIYVMSLPEDVFAINASLAFEFLSLVYC
jgi:hypothetical protein